MRTPASTASSALPPSFRIFQAALLAGNPCFHVEITTGPSDFCDDPAKEVKFKGTKLPSAIFLRNDLRLIIGNIFVEVFISYYSFSLILYRSEERRVGKE